MNRSTGLVAALVLLGASALFITHLLLENYQLKVAVGSLQSQQRATAAAPPPTPAAAADAPEPDRVVSEASRQLMVDALAAETGDEKKLWIRVEPRDKEASTFARQVADVFRDNGWEVVTLGTEGLRYKPGLLLLLGDEGAAPSYVENAQRAIEAAGYPVTVGSGYRSYYESKRKESAEWRGTSFLPEQSYVLLVGRQAE